MVSVRKEMNDYINTHFKLQGVLYKNNVYRSFRVKNQEKRLN